MKSILVIDTPESCETCPLRSYSNMALQCTPLRKTKETDDVCPLLPMPPYTINERDFQSSWDWWCFAVGETIGHELDKEGYVDESNTDS